MGHVPLLLAVDVVVAGRPTVPPPGHKRHLADVKKDDRDVPVDQGEGEHEEDVEDL